MESEMSRMTASLNRKIWRTVNRSYVSKSLSELMHEMLIQPRVLKQENGLHHLEVDTDDQAICYRFQAAPRMLDYWHVFPDTVEKWVNGQQTEIDALRFYGDLQHTIGISPFTLAHFLEETSNTLFADTRILARKRPTASTLAAADYQEIEHSMEGHPWLIINKGRIGFSAAEYERYAPELAPTMRLFWIAVHCERGAFHGINNLSYREQIERELSAGERETFEQLLVARNLSSEEYYLLPVHEWQWSHKLVQLCAADIAQDRIVPLGYGDDLYSPQQSIRTFFNVSDPRKCHVKIALSILNTGLIRGLSPLKLRLAPLITDWIKGLLAGDPYLARCGFTLLGEVASISYSHPHFGTIEDAPYQYQEMLGVIWRESVALHYRPDEKVMTMAALLYIDDQDKPLLAALIGGSRLPVREWIDAYLRAYLRPLLHCFYRHGMFFVPHGENTILVMKDFVPQRVIMKDFVEEVQFAPQRYATVPNEFRPILLQIPENEVTLFVFTDIFDGVFRYLADILVTYLGYEEQTFWSQVADIIHDYQHESPDLAETYAKYDLFVPEFARFCLNRLRLLKYGYDEAAAPPCVPDLRGFLRNPVAEWRRDTRELRTAYQRPMPAEEFALSATESIGDGQERFRRPVAASAARAERAVNRGAI